MNKKEVLEIRKQFSHENCAISRICGCYVDHEKNKRLETTDAFLSLPEEETFKYFEIFKKTLSGTLGKNLINMEFPLEQEKAGGTQEFLLRLRDSQLKDKALLDEFYAKVIDNYIYESNYYIILIYAAYDVPGKTNDGIEMYDAGDEVYNYILCSICPVNLTKEGLSYNSVTNSIEDRNRDWLVEDTAKGFLFPAFTDRSTDIHSVLYYTKKAEDIQPQFIEEMLGSEVPMTAESQKVSFNTIVEETLGNECEYEIVKNIHENLNTMIADNKDNPEPLEITKQTVKNIFEQSGVTNEKIENVDHTYKEVVGDKEVLLAHNIVSSRKFSIETPDVIIKVNPDRADLIETRIIDDRQYIMIAVDDNIEVNGVTVSRTRKNEE